MLGNRNPAANADTAAAAAAAPGDAAGNEVGAKIAGQDEATVVVHVVELTEAKTTSALEVTSLPRPNQKTIFESRWLRFLPALVVWPMWFFLVGSSGAFADVFVDYWPASVAMVVGSFIAGSTPLGGGVVAFPVSVLVLQFTPAESRDASVLVQSVGMNAAAFLLFATRQRSLLDAEFIAYNVLGGAIGIISGLLIPVSAEIVNLVYTVLVFNFGILYFYKNRLAPAAGSEDNSKYADKATVTVTKPPSNALYVGMVAFAVVGGFVTAKVGSGSDIALYAYGVFIWNQKLGALHPRRLIDNSLTASSVVVMGAMSFLTAVLRSLQTPSFSKRVVLTWAAMAFVVVLGAPTGSLVLTPACAPYLRGLFYVLAVVQLALFGALKIQDSVLEWVVIASLTVVEIAYLSFDFWLRRRRAGATAAAAR